VLANYWHLGRHLSTRQRHIDGVRSNLLVAAVAVLDHAANPTHLLANLAKALTDLESAVVAGMRLVKATQEPAAYKSACRKSFRMHSGGAGVCVCDQVYMFELGGRGEVMVEKPILLD
jgi:hypothetical protein